MDSPRTWTCTVLSVHLQACRRSAHLWPFPLVVLLLSSIRTQLPPSSASSSSSSSSWTGVLSLLLSIYVDPPFLKRGPQFSTLWCLSCAEKAAGAPLSIAVSLLCVGGRRWELPPAAAAVRADAVWVIGLHVCECVRDVERGVFERRSDCSSLELPLPLSLSLS